MQLTLIELIEFLRMQPVGRFVNNGFGRGLSYRGHYDQIAFEPVVGTTVGAMLKHAESLLGKTLEGYKGGNYLVTESTLVNLAFYGETTDEPELTLEIVKNMVEGE